MTRRDNSDQPDNSSDSTSSERSRISEELFDETMGPGSAMAHLYRGEIHRMELWRARLDRTTYWSVTVIAAILTWAFSSSDNPHYLILIGVAILTVFLFVEARRFRGYDIWRSRVRLLQENVFAPALDQSGGIPHPDWRERLGRDYRVPTVKLPLEEALAHRLRRVYLPLYGLLLVAWVVRITGFTAREWPASASIAGLSGLVVTAFVAVWYAILIVITVRPREWHVEHELRSDEETIWNDR